MLTPPRELRVRGVAAAGAAVGRGLRQLGDERSPSRGRARRVDRGSNPARRPRLPTSSHTRPRRRRRRPPRSRASAGRDEAPARVSRFLPPTSGRDKSNVLPQWPARPRSRARRVGAGVERVACTLIAISASGVGPRRSALCPNRARALARARSCSAFRSGHTRAAPRAARDARQDEIRPAARQVRVDVGPLGEQELRLGRKCATRGRAIRSSARVPCRSLCRNARPSWRSVVQSVQRARHRRVRRVERHRRPRAQAEIAHHLLRGPQNRTEGGMSGARNRTTRGARRARCRRSARHRRRRRLRCARSIVAVDGVAVLVDVLAAENGQGARRELGLVRTRARAQRQHGFEFREGARNGASPTESPFFGSLPGSTSRGSRGQEDVAELALEQNERGLEDPQVVGHIAAEDDGVALLDRATSLKAAHHDMFSGKSVWMSLITNTRGAVAEHAGCDIARRGAAPAPVDEACDTWDAERVRLRDARQRAAVSTARGLAGAARMTRQGARCPERLPDAARGVLELDRDGRGRRSGGLGRVTGGTRAGVCLETEAGKNQPRDPGTRFADTKLEPEFLRAGVHTKRYSCR